FIGAIRQLMLGFIQCRGNGETSIRGAHRGGGRCFALLLLFFTRSSSRCSNRRRENGHYCFFFYLGAKGKHPKHLLLFLQKVPQLFYKNARLRNAVNSPIFFRFLTFFLLELKKNHNTHKKNSSFFFILFLYIFHVCGNKRMEIGSSKSSEISSPELPVQSSQETKKKRTRPDVSARRQKRKVMQTSCITTKWSLLCKNEFLRDCLENIIVIWNKVALEAYQFANFHVLRCFNEEKPLPVLDQGFFMHCCNASTLQYETKILKDPSMEETKQLWIRN